MPLNLNDEGDIVDERTRHARKSRPRERASDIETGLPDWPRTAELGRSTQSRDGIPTKQGRGSREAERHGAGIESSRNRRGGDDGRTRVYRGRSSDAWGPDDAGSEDRDVHAGNDPMADPPVGWLTIIAGPGKGRVATLGVGVNSIGRAPTERVSLDFGDEMISRANHVAITYDPRGRKFYIQPGGGINLTYINDEPVLQARELAASMRLQIGNTVLRFVPFCGDEFSWNDESASD